MLLMLPASPWKVQPSCPTSLLGTVGSIWRGLGADLLPGGMSTSWCSAGAQCQQKSGSSINEITNICVLG